MSDGVWLLTTVGRPSWRDVVAACEKHGTISQGVVVFDGYQPESLNLPANWKAVIRSYRQGIGPIMQHVYAGYPDAAFYGWLADDTYPRTPDWNVTLERAAGDWRLSYADDGGYIEPRDLARGRHLSSGLCWGGELVRAAGWWALPGLTAAWIDVVWTEIVSMLGLHAYCPGVLVEHKHPRVNGRKWDQTDASSVASIEATRPVYDSWKRAERAATLARIIEACPLATMGGEEVNDVALYLRERADVYELQPDGHRAAYALREAATRFGGGDA